MRKNRIWLRKNKPKRAGYFQEKSRLSLGLHEEPLDEVLPVLLKQKVHCEMNAGPKQRMQCNV